METEEDMKLTDESRATIRMDSTIRRRTSSSLKHQVKDKIKSVTANVFSVKTLKKRLPCLNWIPKYNMSCLAGDLLAGLTVGLMVIPQGLAYGLVAGLTPNYGLYSAFMGGFVYFFLGSTIELSIGPTAIMSLMTYHYSSQGGADYAVFLCFMAGIIEIFAAVVNLGFLINFISEPVISGFTSAAAITIASSQLKGLFGLKLRTKGVVDTWVKVFTNLTDANWADFTLGICCICALCIMKEMRSWKSRCLDSRSEKFQKFWKTVIFYLSVGRNALIVLIATLIAFSLNGEHQPFNLTGEVTPGIPSPKLPPFSTTVNNVTMTFVDMIGDIGIGIVMVPFIAILDNIAVVSATSKGRPFDANQEIIALGVINLLASFFSSLPTTASLSRTAINITSGVRTPAGGLVTGAIVLMALAFLTPFFKFIPNATLAAVIMCAVMHMFDYEIVKPLWQSRKTDVIPLLVTFGACLFIGLEWGILLGIGVNLAMLLFAIATPAVHVTLSSFPKKNTPYVLVTPTIGIFYPSTAHLRSAILKAGLKQGKGSLPVVVNSDFLISIDFTSSKGLSGTIKDFERRQQSLIFLQIKPSIRKSIEVHTKITAYESLEEAEENIMDKKRISQESGAAILLLDQDTNTMQDNLQQSKSLENN